MKKITELLLHYVVALRCCTTQMSDSGLALDFAISLGNRPDFSPEEDSVHFPVQVAHAGKLMDYDLIEAEVSVVGIIDKRRGRDDQPCPDVQILVFDSADIQLLVPPKVPGVFSSLRELYLSETDHTMGDKVHRVSVRGEVLKSTKNKNTLLIYDGTGALPVQTDLRMDVKPGSVVDIVGFPARHRSVMILQHAVILGVQLAEAHAS